jgi:hypothetical protein
VADNTGPQPGDATGDSPADGAGTGASGGDGTMIQDTDTTGGRAVEQPGAGGPTAPRTGAHAAPAPVTGGFPGGPRSPYAQHPGPVRQAPPVPRGPVGQHPYPGPYVPGPRPTPTGPHGVLPGPHVYGWDPTDDEDPQPAGNAVAAVSVILGVLAVLVSLRPLAFGSMAMSWDTYVALGTAVVALTLGGLGLRAAASRPVGVIGMALAVVALLVVAILPTL